MRQVIQSKKTFTLKFPVPHMNKKVYILFVDGKQLLISKLVKGLAA